MIRVGARTLQALSFSGWGAPSRLQAFGLWPLAVVSGSRVQKFSIIPGNPEVEPSRVAPVELAPWVKAGVLSMEAMCETRAHVKAWGQTNKWMRLPDRCWGCTLLICWFWEATIDHWSCEFATAWHSYGTSSVVEDELRIVPSDG